MKKLQKSIKAIAAAKSALYPNGKISSLQVSIMCNRQAQSGFDIWLAKPLLSLLFLLFFYSVGVCQENYVVTATKLNVRKQASAESAVVGTLSKDDGVKVYSFKGVWAEIEFQQGGRAFVSKKFIQKDEDSLQPTIQTTQKVLLSDATPVTQTTETPSPQVVKEETKDDAESDIVVCSYFSFAGKNLFKRANSSFFMLNYGLELGKKWSNTGFINTIGLGVSDVSATSRLSSISIRTNSVFIRIPAHIGYLIGDPDKLHVAARAGVYTDFLLRSKVNDEKLKVGFLDRFSWSGSLRITLGIKGWGLIAEYMFPFQSGGEGMWAFGFNYGI